MRRLSSAPSPAPGIALLIAVPLAFGIALFLTETCPVWLRRPLGTGGGVAGGRPVHHHGMFGLFVFVPLFADHFQVPVQSCSVHAADRLPCLAAVPTALASWLRASCWPSWCCPSVAAVMRDVFGSFPHPARVRLRPGLHDLGGGAPGGAALHAKGVIGGVMLGLGRALGETMAVTL